MIVIDTRYCGPPRSGNGGPMGGGRRSTATALYGESGACRGLGLATWIEVKAPSVPDA